MPSRHHLLADLEDKRRKQAKEGVEVLSWDLVAGPQTSGYDPYDNPGAGKVSGAIGSRRKRNRK